MVFWVCRLAVLLNQNFLKPLAPRPLLMLGEAVSDLSLAFTKVSNIDFPAACRMSTPMCAPLTIWHYHTKIFSVIKILKWKTMSKDYFTIEKIHTCITSQSLVDTCRNVLLWLYIFILTQCWAQPTNSSTSAVQNYFCQIIKISSFYLFIYIQRPKIKNAHKTV